MAQLTRVEMAAIIDAGTPLVFNGRIYTDSDDLPTQGEIDALYSGVGQGAQGEQGEPGEDGADGAPGVVQSVNGQSVADVVLDADDISDAATTKKFTTTAEKNAWDAKLDTGDIAGKADTTYVDSEVSTLESAIATKIDGSALNASNLSSGTVPDARFPAVLPAISGANLTNLPSAGANVQEFTSNGTWTKPSGVKFVHVKLWGAGGGGGGGRRESGSGFVRGGGGGGGAGAYVEYIFPADLLGATEAVTIGTGGTGGAGATSNATNGSNGTAGGHTQFGATFWLKANGGALGAGGTTSAGTAGVGGTPVIPAGSTPYASVDGGAGGSGNGSGSVKAVGIGGATGGGGGGSLFTVALEGGGVGYLVDGVHNLTTGAGANGAAFLGGEGGKGSTTAVGFAGGTGGTYGAGGGGGGAAATANGGAGGNGGNGRAIIISY